MALLGAWVVCVMCKRAAASWHLGPIERLVARGVGRDAGSVWAECRRMHTVLHLGTGALELSSGKKPFAGERDSREASVSMCKVVIVTLGEILKFQDSLGYEGLFHIPVIFFFFFSSAYL